MEDLEMRVAKLDGELAVSLPSDVVERLSLQEADEVEFKPGLGHTVTVERRMTLEEAEQIMKSFQISLPSGWKFDREEANAR
jgi:antitoxin MazE